MLIMPAGSFVSRNAAAPPLVQSSKTEAITMSEDQEQTPRDPEARALSGNPDGPPQQADHTVENDRELLRQGEEEEEEEAASGKAAPDGAGGSDRPGTTLPGYG
jgi:hypothetical protein